MADTIKEIPLEELHPFPDHPFGVRDDDTMQQTVESVREYGVLVPGIARPREGGGYEIIAGHRRKHACELAERKNAIEDAIFEHYRDNCFDGSCVSGVIDRFGMERVAFVLANTVQDKDWDGRISADNKAWAKEAPVPNDYNAWGGRRTHEYVCSQAHPGLINLFVNRFRKEQEIAKEKKPSVLQKLNEAKQDVPKKSPGKTKEAEL